MPTELSYPKHKIKVLLLEGIHDEGVEMFREEGLSVRVEKRSLDERELLDAIEDVHVLGIRSKTRVGAHALERARRILAIGAFCIGTNQLDLVVARTRGVPVFNAPHSNTRSVAELVVANVVLLFRGLYDRIRACHEGVWAKGAGGSAEVRGKTLGIVGYGHIGSQVSVLAEAMGMRVVYHDIVDKLALGNATRADSLRALLESADVVTLHVPETRETAGMIGAEQIARMRPGSYLINTSRGKVVDLQALRAAIESGHLAGAAVDVFPEEPRSTSEGFHSPLRNLPNVVLTPHIGGSTQEAQRNIGREVATKLIRFVNNGSTEGAVNFPNVVLPELADHHRILHVHRNLPGVLQKVNAMFGERGINVAAQHLRTDADVGYLIMDTDKSATREMIRELKRMPESIKVRALF